MSPDAFLLRCVRWQLFAGLTFKRDVMSERHRVTMVFAALRALSDGLGVPFPRLVFALRLERGEHCSRRVHLHALVAGLPESSVNSRTCFAFMRLWKRGGGGWSRVRTWEAGADACEYMAKPPGWSFKSANDYESAKFGPGACQVILSQSAKTLGMFTRSLRYKPGEDRRRQNSEFAARRIQGRASTSASQEPRLNRPLPYPSQGDGSPLKKPASTIGAMNSARTALQKHASNSVYISGALWIDRGDGTWVLGDNSLDSKGANEGGALAASLCRSGDESLSSADHVGVQESGRSFGEFSRVTQPGDKPRGITPGQADGIPAVR